MSVPNNFSNLFNALDYAYGCSGKQRPTPLIVGIGTGLTGAVTLTLAYSYSGLPDGSQFFPLNTNAPITIGSGSNAETVTPSAVTNATSNAGNNTCTVTATVANAHGIGDRISSGTFGLREAINAAAAAGGGTVIVTAGWAAAGGTSAMIATAMASISATVSILDNRSGQGVGRVQTLMGTLTNTQVKALNSAPVSLIPAQGSGTLIDVIDAVLENVFATAAFANGGAIQLSYGTGTTIPASATVAATFLTSPVANQSIKVAGALATNLSSAVLNTAVYIAAATADFITGAGTMKYRINFVVHTGL